ncbi:MAG: nitroreductase family protein [Thermoanaerobaculia bacterium]
MAEELHLVDLETCRGDGICVDICPENVLEILDGKAATVESRAGTCILCGQCVAVCPTEALQMPQLPANDFGELAKLPFGYDEFLDFLQLRRSVRVFKDRPVERDLTEKILAAAATAPMGMPPHSTEVVVIDQREELDLLLEELVKDYASLVRAFSNPVGRAMVRLASGAENYRMLKDYIVELARYANEAYTRDGTDRYMYRAPVVMLFHGNRWAMSYEENAHLVCHHAMLAAVSLGLGTTIIGLIPPIVDRSKVLRQRYGIPKKNKVMTSLILGYPKYKYKKSIHRDLAGVRMM